MLLPSDVARLVLGYLQQEKLTSTCRSFIAESPNLKEYAEHCTDDGFIPGCLLSLFGKNLTTILNEYIALKAKENKDEVPLMVSSLWKKLDHTLSQIRSMQDSVAFQTHQRARTRSGIEDIRRQRMLISPLSSSATAVSRHMPHKTSTPIAATQVVLRPLLSQGVSQTIASPMFGGQSTVQNTSPPANINSGESLKVFSLAPLEKKQPSALSSPMRRKTDSQRKRRSALSSSVAASLDGETGGDGDALQELIDDNFPQLVIENAREKILSNKSLQEKLAENINKFLGSDSAAQTSKQSDCGAVEHDTSIDEILGLQGEIHMSEEAIHDILTQTELDPDFQELYDLFACSTSKVTRNPPREPATQKGASKNNVTVEENLESMKILVEKSDVDSTSQTSKSTDVKETEKASSTAPDVTAVKTNINRAPSPTNEMQLCVDETTSALNQSSPPNEEQQSVGPTDNADRTRSDTAVDMNGGSQETVLERSPPSQSKDVEMADEPIETNTHLTDSAMSSTSSLEERISPNVKGLKDTCDQLSPTNSCQIVTDEEHSEEILQETEESHIDAQQCEAEPQQVVVLDSDVPPVQTPQKEQDNQLGRSTSPNQTDGPMDLPVSIQLQADSISMSVNEINSQPPQVPELLITENPSMQNVSPVPAGGSLTSESTPSSSIIMPASQVTIDPSQIVTLSFITEDLTGDTELRNAIQSISRKNSPSVTFSPVQKPQQSNPIVTIQSTSSEEVSDSSLSGDPSHSVIQFSDPSAKADLIQPEECTVYSVAGTSNVSTDGGLIQLIPATSSSFAPSNSVFISPCMTNSSAANQSNIMMLPNTSAQLGNQKQPCVFQTPPRQANVYTVGQAISPKLSQGSTIILASSVQPVLQGVVGMFPVSVMGPGTNAFTAPSHQVLHVPVSKGGIPKIPLPPKSQKPAAPRGQTNTGKPVPHPAADSESLLSSSRVQRPDNAEKSTASEHLKKTEVRLPPDTRNPNVKVSEAHRRVLCFDKSATTTVTSNTNSLCSSTPPQSKDQHETTSSLESPSSSRQNLSKDTRKSDKPASLVVTSSKPDIVTQLPNLEPSKDQSVEKKPTAAESAAGVKANKENVLQVETEKQVLKDVNRKTANPEGAGGSSDKTAQPSQEPPRKQISIPNILRRTPQKLPVERNNPISPLAKPASDPLQGMQFNSPNPKLSVADLPIPRTPGSGMDERLVDDSSERLKTPTTKRYSEDGGTPKPMLPPATPELPTCSPASEAGSENSVNMAAHTLMILSRATISKSGSTPLKDTQQLKSSKSTSKKRKLEDADEYQRQSHKKELLSPSSLLKKKKIKKHRKKNLDSFPAGMDVEKFLMSLHYDE
ncbi:protein NPAT [Rhinophrynus dorsalis]